MKTGRLIILILSFIVAILAHSHSIAQSTRPLASTSTKELFIYPNPVNNDRLFISSSQNSKKTIEIFDVLGKRILATSIIGNELNVSKLSPGVYIIKIKDTKTSITRKLIIK